MDMKGRTIEVTGGNYPVGMRGKVVLQKVLKGQEYLITDNGMRLRPSQVKVIVEDTVKK